MAIGGQSRGRGNPEDDLQDWTRLQVRAGFRGPEELLVEVTSSVEAEIPGIDAGILARAWIAGARADVLREAGSWPDPTDHERLLAVVQECAEHDLSVLEGVEDEREVKTELERRTTSGTTVRGISWFGLAEVAGAVEHGILELGLRTGTGELPADDDALVAAVLSCCERHGLTARWSSPRLQVRHRWQRRL